MSVAKHERAEHKRLLNILLNACESSNNNTNTTPSNAPNMRETQRDEERRRNEKNNHTSAHQQRCCMTIVSEELSIAIGRNGRWILRAVSKLKRNRL